MKTNFELGLKALGMSVESYISFMKSTGKCDMKYLIKMLQTEHKDGSVLERKVYKFKSGPFKGSSFYSKAPNTVLMNQYPNFEVIFIDGPCAGIKTTSLITYDQTIEEKTKKWLKLL